MTSTVGSTGPRARSVLSVEGRRRTESEDEMGSDSGGGWSLGWHKLRYRRPSNDWLRAAGCGGGAVRANPGLPTAILSPFRALVGRSGWIRATPSPRAPPVAS